MSNGILFDNFIVADNKRVADQWAADSWRLKQGEENAAAVSLMPSQYTVFRKSNIISAYNFYGKILLLHHLNNKNNRLIDYICC